MSYESSFFLANRYVGHPTRVFDRLDAIFNFDLDVCASPENAKCEKFFTAEQDGLSQEWSGVCWMNPPYGRTIGQWMKKAHESSLLGATVVCLVPARTCTRWWHDYATKGDIHFLRGRLKFGDAANSAPFPSALVVFTPWDTWKERLTINAHRKGGDA